MERGQYSSSLTILYVVSGVIQASMNIIFLALPLYALAIAASPFEIGVIGAAGGLTYSLMAMFLGSSSERFSQKGFIIVGTILQAASSLFYLACSSPLQLILVRIVQSLGLALFWPVIEALVAVNSRSDTLEHALVGYNISWGTANAVGAPLAGFLITVTSLTVPFYVTSIVALLVSTSLIVLRNRTEDDPLPVKQSERVLIVEKPMPYASFLPMTSTFAYAFVSGTVYTLFPVFATELGMPAYQMGLVFFASNVAQTLIFVVSERVLRRFAMRSFLLGLVAFTASLILIATVNGNIVFAISFTILGFGQGILYSSSLYYLLIEGGRNRVRATGTFESTLGLASFLGPLFGGAVAQFNSSYPYMAGAILSLLVLVSELFIIRAETQKRKGMNLGRS